MNIEEKATRFIESLEYIYKRDKEGILTIRIHCEDIPFIITALKVYRRIPGGCAV